MENEQLKEQVFGDLSQSSVEFQTNTKGVLSFKVKVYNPDPETAYNKAVELSNKAEAHCKQKNGEI